MSIKIPKSVPAVQIEPGTYIARCYSMIHIGTVSYEWQGQTNSANKVRITFELPTEKKNFKEGEEAKPLVISGEWTLSLGKKAKLKPILESWRGKAFSEEEANDFDVTKLVGVPAFLSIIQNEKGYPEIAGISKLPKGTECPAQVNKSVILDYDNWSDEEFAKLPDFLKKKIESSVEYQKMRGTYQKTEDEEFAESGESNPDLIPF